MLHYFTQQALPTIASYVLGELVKMGLLINLYGKQVYALQFTVTVGTLYGEIKKATDTAGSDLDIAQ